MFNANLTSTQKIGEKGHFSMQPCDVNVTQEKQAVQLEYSNNDLPEHCKIAMLSTASLLSAVREITFSISQGHRLCEDPALFLRYSHSLAASQKKLYYANT